MSNWSRIYYKLFNVILNLLVKSKSIPPKPTLELGINCSCPIIYVLLYNSKSDLLTLRSQSLIHNLPDPLEPLHINGTKFPRYVFIFNNSSIFTSKTTNEEYIKLFNKYLILYQNNFNIDIQTIPISIIFGRHPKYNKKNINAPCRFKRIRKFFTIIWLGRNSFVLFSQSVSLRKIITKHGIDTTIANKLARVAKIHFIRQQRATTGPNLISRKNLFKKILMSKAIIRAINDEIRNKNISYKTAQNNIIFLMKEMIANFSYKMIQTTDRILRIILNCLYQKINVHNVSKIHLLAQNGHKIVYIPCHRSHMDYLLLSYVLYHQGLVPPHIAAGVNLNVWPSGLIFRNLGAFFIRRTFKGNKLYSIIFREYLCELFNHGYSIEYFIEGKRSRTGRLLCPKTGILSITIQAILRNNKRPITFIPVYIGYEHIIEIDAYITELSKDAKNKKSIFKKLSIFNKISNCGNIDINFGEPLSLIDWLNQHIPKWKESIDKIDTTRPIWLTKTTHTIAVDLMTRINNASTVNAINLCYTALLATKGYSLTRKQLSEQLDCYLKIIRNVPYASNPIIPSLNANKLIDHALKINKLQLQKSTINDSITFSDRKTALIPYYRNNIIHMLVLPSLIATVIIQYRQVSRQKLFNYIKIFYPFLKTELFLRWDNNELTIELDKLVNELFRQKLILLNQNTLYVNPTRSYTLQLLAAGIQDILQRYTIIFWLLNKNPLINQNTLRTESYILARKLSNLYTNNSSEFHDKTIFNTITKTLCTEGYIGNKSNTTLKKTKIIYQILKKLINPKIGLIIEKSK